MKNDMWREFINSIPVDLPENGKPHFEPVVETKEDDSLENKEAKLQKFVFHVYLISLTEEPYKSFMISSDQTMEDMGNMTVKEALRKIKTRKRRKNDSE